MVTVYVSQKLANGHDWSQYAIMNKCLYWIHWYPLCLRETWQRWFESRLKKVLLLSHSVCHVAFSYQSNLQPNPCITALTPPQREQGLETLHVDVQGPGWFITTTSHPTTAPPPHRPHPIPAPHTPTPTPPPHPRPYGCITFSRQT